MAIRNLNTAQQPLNDLSPMPFGKYKGTPMQDVPASYLHYLWTNDCSDLRIRKYIETSLSALKDENPDLIW